MQQACRAWVIHDLLPEPELIRELYKEEKRMEYSISGLTFLWCVSKFREGDIEAEFGPELSVMSDALFGILKDHANFSDSVLSGLDIRSCVQQCYWSSDWSYWNKSCFAEIVFHHEGRQCKALYTLVRDSEGEGLEAIVMQDSNLSFRIRHVAAGASQEMREVRQRLFLTYD
jgi:hypothetical protein